MKYPVRCEIIDAAGKMVFPGIKAKTPDASKPHIGEKGLAEKIGDNVRITLDNGSILWGYECWWRPLDSHDSGSEGKET